MIKEAGLRENDGTWFLSYLCEIGTIENFDSVQSNCVEGKLLKPYWGLPVDFTVYVEMGDDDILDIAYSDPNEIQKLERDNEDEIWWEIKSDLIGHKRMKINLSYEEVQ